MKKLQKILTAMILNLIVLLLVACTKVTTTDTLPALPIIDTHSSLLDTPSNNSLATATFAGGCFWCMEGPFEKVNGVKEVISGYTGGFKENPTYKEVSSGTTGHREAVLVTYDPNVISYNTLLNIFWKQINPTDAGGQFVDRGMQYTSAIYYKDDEQKVLAETSKQALADSGRYDTPLVTEILPTSIFYPAEDYHQDYYKKNPTKYHFYRYNSGRDQFLDKVWGNERA